MLATAANKNFVPALRTLDHLALQDDSRRELALQCLNQAALAGDIASCFALGLELRASNPGHAAHWLNQAALAGYPFAQQERALLGEAAAPPNIERQPIDADDLPLRSLTQNILLKEVCNDPSIKVFSNVLNKVDCAYLMFIARPLMTRAGVIDPGGDKAGYTSNVRTNMSTFLPFGDVDIIARHIEEKIMAAIKAPLPSSEPMSVLWYSNGESYEPHFDFFSPNLEVSQKHLAEGGQRLVSAITYLAEPDQGGSTNFPELDITIDVKAGDTLWFRNCDDQGQPDRRTLHSGDPVSAVEKWVVTKWIRESITPYLEF